MSLHDTDLCREKEAAFKIHSCLKDACTAPFRPKPSMFRDSTVFKPHLAHKQGLEAHFLLFGSRNKAGSAPFDDKCGYTPGFSLWSCRGKDHCHVAFGAQTHKAFRAVENLAVLDTTSPRCQALRIGTGICFRHCECRGSFTGHSTRKVLGFCLSEPNMRSGS